MNTRQQILEVQQRMGEAIIWQQTVIERLLIPLLAKGNALMEGLPGTAKTRTKTPLMPGRGVPMIAPRTL